MFHLTICAVIPVLVALVQAVPAPVPKHSRIFGGEEAEPHSIPFMAYLEIVISESEGSFTYSTVNDGVLITPNAVLTTAEIFVTYPEFVRVEIHLGVHDAWPYPDIPAARNSSGPNVIVHSDFTLDSLLVNNIAICRWEDPVELNDLVNVVPLPFNPDNDYVGELATVSGWGGSENNDAITDLLQKMEVKVISNVECGSPGDDVLCTSQEGGKSVCTIDNGGPLVSSAGELIGMVIAAPDCWNLTEFGPSYYARISSHLRWIAQNV